MLAGCMSEDEKKIRLGEIYMVNNQNQDAEINVEIKKEGDKVYEETHMFAPVESGTAESIEIVDDSMGDPVYYDVSFDYINNSFDTSYSTEDAENFVDEWGDDECFRLVASIELDRINLAIAGMESC